MAQHVRVELVDDLDGSPAQETIEFGLDGLLYTIDLSAAHARQLRTAFAPYVAGARRSAAARRSVAEKPETQRPDKPAPRPQDDNATARIRALTERVKQNQRSTVPVVPEPNPVESEETTITLPTVLEVAEPREPRPAPAVLAPVFQPPQQ